MLNLLVLANKRYHTDFRKYLMRAAERAGGRALHIYCWEQVIVSCSTGEQETFPHDVDAGVIARLAQYNLGEDKRIALTGLGCNEAPIAVRLQDALHNTVWVYDVYDDLMFASTGAERLKRMVQDAIWRCRCEHAIVLDKALQSRYPRAHHLDNASHLRPIPRVAQVDPRNMVYIGSMDSRVDFDWLDALTAQNVQLEIYGRVHESAPEVKDRIDHLLGKRSNVVFRGSYQNDNLWSILDRFRVGVLPYHVDHPMTRHVNPDKLYHYLNAGLEVLAAPIPAVKRLAPFLHAIKTDGPWSDVLRDIAAKPRESWPVEEYTWDKRWSELASISSV